MFDKTEINQIDKKYFQILQANMHPKTIKETQELIKSHDKWHLQNRSKRILKIIKDSFER